ncbi:MAG: glycosyltransferase family 2 protein [Nitrospirae bacterium]|nr:glycosyltransferase family 2 protein [Nitrospirota bacterium]
MAGRPADLPLASVIVLNWNGEALLAECVDSLLAQTYPRLEVIVVDNASSDRSVAVLGNRYGEKIRLIVNDANLGFAAGNNVGIAASKGAYVLLINNDAVADARWVAALVREAEADHRVGMCASKILTYDDPDRIDSVGLLLSRDGLGRGRGRLQRDAGRFNRPDDALVPSGCAALYRRAMLDQIGLFDEAFFMYCEDLDLGLRGRLAGWRCRFAPDAVVRHRYSASAGRYSLRKVFLVERNRVWVMAKSFPVSALALSPIWTIGRLAWQAYAGWQGQGGTGRALEGGSAWALAMTVGRAWLAAARGLPAMLRKRRPDHVSLADFRRWLRDHGVSVREVAFTE